MGAIRDGDIIMPFLSVSTKVVNGRVHGCRARHGVGADGHGKAARAAAVGY